MRHRNKILNSEGGEGLKQAAQRKCGYPITGTVAVQVRQSFEQSGLVKVPLSLAGELELNGLLCPFPTKSFYDSLILELRK